MSPFKNVFCRHCNGLHSNSIYYVHVQRKFDDVGINVNIYSFYHFNPLNAVSHAYTEFRAIRFESIATADEIRKDNTDDEYVCD